MRAGLRFGIAALAAALALAPMPALAQDTAAPATNTPAASAPPPETIGPRELRDFTINGTVTRPAPVAPPRAAPPRTTTAPATTTTAPRETTAERDRPAPAPVRERPSPASSVGTSLPPSDALSDTPTDASSTVAPQPGFAPDAPLATDSGDQPSNYLPWLLALLLLGAAAGLYVWRQRAQPRYATAGGVADAFVAPEPAPQPLQRAPAPRPATPTGVVSTRIRPWLEIEFSPGRCVVQEDKATIQFDVAVYNSGSAPARDVLIEASMFNAGPAQDQEIGAFFAHPNAKGDRIPAIPPLKRVALKSAVSLTLEQMRQFEVAGKRIFVPLIGFNALYRWSGGDGQTSASYLVGRDTKSEKMAPLRLDLGPRIFRGLGARQHNLGVRT